MNFIIFNLNDGSQKPCNLANLSQSLSPNCEIMRIIGDKHEAIGYVSHKTLVHFAIESADYALQNYSKKILPEAQTCIDLTRKWLQDQRSVSADQLKQAANAAYAAHYAAAHAAYAAHYAAADAADAATYAYAAYAAAANAATAAYASYANAAAYASYANAAADAAAHAANAAGENKLDEQNRQGTFILKFFEVE
jgi:hypothetical protein